MIKKKFTFLLGWTLGLVTASAWAQTQQWTAQYNGTGNNFDRAKAMTVDSSGNVYVTGRSWGGITNYDYATVKYDPTGFQLWAARYNGPGNGNDGAMAIALDVQGNVYATGYSLGSGSNYDYATIKYDAFGNQLWAARFNGAANGVDVATAIALDDQGNVYVTGYSMGVNSGFDYVTIKYHPMFGFPIWTSVYNGPANGLDVATALTVDAGGVYVTGRSVGIGTGLDYATVKYDPTSGNQLWVARYNGPGNGNDGAVAIAQDSSGVYVTGFSWGGPSTFDYATLKYDPATGNQLWVARYDGPAGNNDQATALAVSGGAVYVTGFSWGGPSDYDYATVKYDAGTGNPLWVSRYNGPGNNTDIATGLAVSMEGVYVTGRSVGAATNFDYATLKYDPANGNQLWEARYNGPGNDIDVATMVTLDGTAPQPNVYVTGGSWNPITDFDYLTIKYSQP